MSKPGPSIGLTDGIIKKFTDLILKGNYLEPAAAVTGYSHQTMRRWLASGRKLIAEGEAARLAGKRAPRRSADDKLLVKLATKYAIASAKAETDGVEEIYDARKGRSKGNHGASINFLERRYSARWGQKINATINEELDVFLQRIEQNLDVETFERVLRAANGEVDRRPSSGPRQEAAGRGGGED